MARMMEEVREALLGAVARAVEPAAARRVGDFASFTAIGIPFGAPPKARAFGAEGELRFELGAWRGDAFVPFKAPVFFPLDPACVPVAYPKELVLNVRNVNAHYTPVTRRLDFVEVWDYFSTKHFSEKQVRAQAMGVVARAALKDCADGRLAADTRFIRLTEQYVVVTCLEAPFLTAAARAEYAALRNVTCGG